MNLQYSAHARTRMLERGVTEAEVEQVLALPLRTITAQEDRSEMQGLLSRDGKPMLLRVIVAHGVVLTVITVILTSQLQRYGVTP